MIPVSSSNSAPLPAGPFGLRPPKPKPAADPVPATAPPPADRDFALRPKTLADFTGQDTVVNNLRIAIDAAKQRGEAMDHVLLTGPSGLGKTSLSMIIASELGVAITVTNGASLRKGALPSTLRHLKPKEVLFIDEIHGMDRKEEEAFYSALEDCEIVQKAAPTSFYSATAAPSRPIPLNPFTTIGATTRPGKISEPMRNKFKITLELELYTVDELMGIVARSSKLLNAEIHEEAVRDIANCARGVPRIANNFLRRARDYAQVVNNGLITGDAARQALDLIGIDRWGLGGADRKIIEALTVRFDGAAVGLSPLAAAINEDVDTVEHVCEPHLLRLGLVNRTPRGRIATGLAFEYLDKSRACRQ